MINLQLITMLYDLALVTSGEIKASSLIQKTLQRLLYHTSFPTGMYLSYVSETHETEACVEMHVESVIGNKQLRAFRGKKVCFPQEMIGKKPSVMEDKSIVEKALLIEIGYNAFLILPVMGTGAFILMSKASPEFQYPYEHVFTPVLQNFRNSLTLLQANENLLNKMEEETKKYKKLSEELAQAKNRMQIAINAIPARIFWKDRNSVYLGCNHLFSQDAGMQKSDDLIGKTDYDTAWGKDPIADAYRKDDTKVMESGIPKLNYEEKQVRGEDGTLRWLETSKVPLKDAHGSIIGVLGTYQDITDRKHMQERLLDSEHHLAKAQEIANMGNWVWDMRTNNLFWSDQAFRIFGLDPCEIRPSYEVFQQFIHPDDIDFVTEAINTAITKKSTYKIQHRIIHTNNQVRNVEEIGEIELDAEGNAIRMNGVVIDITEKVKTEADLELYRRMIENTADPIFVIDDEDQCKMIYVNEAAVRHFDESRETILTWRIPDWDPNFTYADLPSHVEEIKKIKNLQIETQHKVHDQLVPVEITLNMTQYKGKVCHFGYFKNISERKKNEEELRKAKITAENANQIKSEFLANMSHEIRTPMNGIIGMTQLCLQTQLNPQQRSYLEKSYAASNSLLRIINDILDFSKIEANKLDLEAGDVEIQKIFRELAHQLSDLAHGKGIELLFWFAPVVTEYIFIGDDLRIKQVLMNLIANAIKFTQNGHVIVRTDLVKIENKKATLSFEVVDTGIGISPDSLSRLFQSFQQADSSTTRQFGGTGLGLAISKRLVSMMNGHIGAESELGHGSRFYFNIEIGVSERVPELTKKEHPDLRGMRALIVDDNRVAVEILEKVLVGFGIQTTTALSAMEALNILQNQRDPKARFDLIFVDWKMPEMNGIEFMEELQKGWDVTTLPTTIMVSAHSRNTVTERAKNIGISQFLLKPFSPSDVLNTIHMAISGKPEGADTTSPDMQLPPIPRKLIGTNILLVEDNEINMEVGVNLLQSLGMKVVTAENGQDAIDKILSVDIDAVLMDIQMPIMDGFTATREIRKIEQFKDLPIIALTAHALKEERDLGLVAGMNEYTTKPIDLEDMIHKLEKVMKREPSVDEAPFEQGVSPQIKIPATYGINEAIADANCAYNMKLRKKLFQNFATSYEFFTGKVTRMIQQEDYKSAGQSAHTLVSIAGNIGAMELSRLARELEYSVQRSGQEKYDSLKKLDKELTQVIDGIKALKLGEPSQEQVAKIGFDQALLMEGVKDLAKAVELANPKKVSQSLEKIKSMEISLDIRELIEELELNVSKYQFEEAGSLLQKLTNLVENI